MKHNQPTLTDEVTLTMRGLCHKRAICMYRVLENAEAEGMDPAFLWKSLREYGYDTGKNIEKAMEQSRSDARQGEIPIVAHRKNRQPWLVTMDLGDFLELYVQASL